jgi:hypothetical protein
MLLLIIVIEENMGWDLLEGWSLDVKDVLLDDHQNPTGNGN